MKLMFPTKASASADGQAAWALLYGLMKVLRSKGLLTDDDVREAIGKAQSVVPSQPNARNDETKEMLTDMAKSMKTGEGR